jgi:hypothetical protein
MRQCSRLGLAPADLPRLLCTLSWLVPRRLSNLSMHLLKKLSLVVLGLFALLNLKNSYATEPPLPIASGTYRFEHKFAEQPNTKSIPLLGIVKGRKIELINRTQSKVFPLGSIAQGTLTWHAASKQWIIGLNKSDKLAVHVGGCSDGPEVIDLIKKIYWTC